MDVWVGLWVEVKSVLWIGYINQKLDVLNKDFLNANSKFSET
jgi:hypothetical protein